MATDSSHESGREQSSLGAVSEKRIRKPDGPSVAEEAIKDRIDGALPTCAAPKFLKPCRYSVICVLLSFPDRFPFARMLYDEDRNVHFQDLAGMNCLT